MPRINFNKKLASQTEYKIGLPPGSLIYTGEKKVKEEKITIIDYNKRDFQIKETKEILPDLYKIENNFLRWINLEGLHNVELINNIGKQFDLHDLLLEDVLSPHQRPKIEDFENYIFIVLKMMLWNKFEKKIQMEQVSLVLGKNYVISFLETDNGLFNPIINRLKTAKGRIRKMNADYLLYSLIDVMIDNYFVIMDKIGKNLDKIEEDLVETPDIGLLQSIHSMKREIITIKKEIWPSRNIINSLQRDNNFITEDTQLYLRDLYDHVITIIDNFENFRDIISSMIDTFLSSVSNRMNEIMKVLTIISTIFIPLSFLAGLYGMNFANMPELSSPFGYPLLIILMISIALLMLAYFRKKKWI